MSLEHKSVVACWLVGAIIIIGMGYSVLDAAEKALAPIQDYHTELEKEVNK